jgi:hypothetical protein
LSSKKGRSSPIPRAIGAAGDCTAGVSDALRPPERRVSLFNVALSVAIPADIDRHIPHCERPAESAPP